MTQNIHKIKAYYDLHLPGKLDGFLNGNERVELAWRSITANFHSPTNILEVGCGIGDIAWRMANEWKESTVTGIDISPKSIEFATKVFSGPKLNFVEGTLPSKDLIGPYDLIVMMDVFEHIASTDRPTLYTCLKQLLTDNGSLFISFPTPRHLQWLRDFHPEQIQPVDEDVNLQVIMELSIMIERDVKLYKEVDVWYNGDYAHAIFSKNIWKPFIQSSSYQDSSSNGSEYKSKIDKIEKLKMLKRKLGNEYE